MTLEVKETTVADVLKKLEGGAWQVPQFQRDFVWNESQVISLVASILAARPIGMVTLWEQPDEHQLPLEKISVTDTGADGKAAALYFGDPKAKPKQFFAVLDGRQRSTAIAMVFGGLAPKNGNRRFAGKFFLNVATRDSTKQILFKSHKQISDEGLETLPACVGRGLLPLSVTEGGASTLFDQWLDYVDLIKQEQNYPAGLFPNKEELARRVQVVRDAFRGINDTKLAIYIVPDSYDLEKICDIFETLNTTGTKVSTVDLIHATLYQQTHSDPDGGINLRDWMDEVGEIDGAVGWASSTKRPELLAQIVTASYAGLEDKPAITREAYKKKEITSVKSGDLLATPSDHWKNVVSHQVELAKFLGDFQKVVAEGFFPFSECPYPASAAIYVALRWHIAFDIKPDRPFGIDEANAVYCAFFWRNALTGRYNQGFLTQLGEDLRFLKASLYKCGDFDTRMEWAQSMSVELTEHMDVDVPDKERLEHLLLVGRNTGALQKALLLPLVGRRSKDVLSQEKIAYPEKTEVEIHHIYPRNWCKNNIAGELAAVLDPAESGNNYVESVANLMPLARVSNQKWRAKAPGQAISEAGLDFGTLSDLLDRYFIDEAEYNLLTAGTPKPLEFWQGRATKIADYLLRRLQIRI